MKSSITSLQAGRAFAALMVVFYHLNLFILPQRLYDGQHLHTVFNFGYAGVEFFFALSGFIMMFVHREDFGTSSKFGRYVFKRITRIYPVYWLILFALLIAWAILPGIGPEIYPSAQQMIYDATLLPTQGEPLLNVAWTLQHEMLFYAIFGLSICSRRLGMAIFFCWFSACAMGVLFGGVTPFPASFVFSPYNLIFLFGMLAALAYRHIPVHAAWTLLVGGVTAFIAIGLGDVYNVLPLSHGHQTVAFGVAASLAITGAAALENMGKLGTPHALKVLGDSSYSLYLIHMPVMVTLAPIFVGLGLTNWMPLPVTALLFVIAAVSAGLIVHFVFERPLMNFIKTYARPSIPV